MKFTREDVLTAARRLYSESGMETVASQLDKYGAIPDEPERARVQLAILKLSGGSQEKLSHFVEAARRDYRDVLLWSENPEEPPTEPLFDVLRRHWAWALSEPLRVIAQNPFGNLLVEVGDGSIWRVCPEDLAATRLADSAAALGALSADLDFMTDWEVESWVEAAETKLGPLEQGQCYGFRIWPVLGAAYSADNIAIKSLLEWLAASGDAGGQVKNLPPGTRIRLDTGDA